jgi:protein subunit release factor A
MRNLYFGLSEEYVPVAVRNQNFNKRRVEEMRAKIKVNTLDLPHRLDDKALDKVLDQLEREPDIQSKAA